jgi:hypothetical protein
MLERRNRSRVYAGVKSSSLLISMLFLMDRATEQPSAYTSSTRSIVSRSPSSATRWKVAVMSFLNHKLERLSRIPHSPPVARRG